ncbi:MAG TPA: hypothetical protein DCR14_18125 [Acidimicrobiaceae bacterium]|nr:hypothetical protein [Acidimicrobiaceae bacterium]
MHRHLAFVDLTEREVARCVRLAHAVPHDSPLDHLPGWDAGELLAHLVGDFRWATRILTSRSFDGSILLPAEEKGEVLSAALEREGERMVAALAAAAREPDVRCTNFAEGDRGTVGWWVRHQLHETTLHRWDLEVPTGQHQPIPPEQADDGIDELLHTYTRRYAPHRLAAPLQLHTSDEGSTWRVRPVGSRGQLELERLGATGNADEAVLAAPAADLLLLLWRRLEPGAIDSLHIAESADLPADAVVAFLDGPITA